MHTRASVGDGTNVIAAADADPNTTAPAANRIFTLPTLFPGGGFPSAWLIAEGGTPTIELWYLVSFPETPSVPSRWFRWNNAAVSVPVDQMTPFTTPSIPIDLPAFLRVTTVNGAKRVSIGVTA